MSTIAGFERGNRNTSREAIAEMQGAFEEYGVVFISEDRDGSKIVGCAICKDSKMILKKLHGIGAQIVAISNV
ncbi:hypothetical protein [Methylobacterium soli]|nr:hypothetical protein [Methylobacterium soli]